MLRLRQFVHFSAWIVAAVNASLPIVAQMPDQPSVKSPVDATWKQAALNLRRLVRDVHAARRQPLAVKFGCEADQLKELTSIVGTSIPDHLVQFLCMTLLDTDFDMGRTRLLSVRELLELNRDSGPLVTMREDCQNLADFRFVGLAYDGGGDAWVYDLKNGGVCLIDVSTSWEGSHDGTLDTAMEYFPTLLAWVDYMRVEELDHSLRSDNYDAFVYEISPDAADESRLERSVSVVQLPCWYPGAELSRASAEQKSSLTVMAVKTGTAIQLKSMQLTSAAMAPISLPMTAAAARHLLTRRNAPPMLTIQLANLFDNYRWSEAVNGEHSPWVITAKPTDKGVSLRLPALPPLPPENDERARQLHGYVSDVFGMDIGETFEVYRPKSLSTWKRPLILVELKPEMEIANLQANFEGRPRATADYIVVTTVGNDGDVLIRKFDCHYGKHSEFSSFPALSAIVPYWANKLKKTDLRVTQVLNDRAVTTPCRMDDQHVQAFIDVQRLPNSATSEIQ